MADQSSRDAAALGVSSVGDRGGRQGPVIVGVGLLCFVVAAAVDATRGYNSWIVVDHLVSYRSHGFLRRALVGSLVEPWIDDLDDVRISFLVVSAVGALALTALLVAVARRLDDDGQRWTAVPVTAWLLTTVGSEPGRTDAIVLPLLVALWLWADDDGPPVVGALLLASAALVHEIGLLWGIAIVVAAASTGRLAAARAATVGAVGVVVGAVLLLAGGFDGSDEQFLDRLTLRPPLADRLIIDRSAPWTGSPADGFASVRTWVDHSATVDVVLLPVVALVCAVVLWRRVGGVVAVVTVGPAALLALVGVDHLRWATLLIAITLLQLAFARAWPRMRSVAALTVAGALALLGPIGVAQAFPYWIG